MDKQPDEQPDEQPFVNVKTFRTRQSGLRTGDNYFAVIYRTSLPVKILQLFITQSLDGLNYHLEHDPRLKGYVLAKGTLTEAQMNWREVHEPLTEAVIPEFLRRAFADFFLYEHHLEDFLKATVVVPSKPLGICIANIIGKTLH